MNSMTGYGYSEALKDGTFVSVEIKSVNSRFLDLSVNIPPFLNSLEQRIRGLVCQKVQRGKVDVNIRIRDENPVTKVTVDKNAAAEYYRAMQSLSEHLNLTQKEIPLSLIIQQEGVLTLSHEYDAERYWEKITDEFTAALDSFCLDRAREGKNLKSDLLSKLSVLEECQSFFETFQPQMEEKFRTLITKKFEEIVQDRVDENRIMQETAAMMVKYTINEEIIRLKSHLEAMRKEIQENPAPGKRLDFICQEANREINTIGSKNQFTQVAEMVITAKDALENIREQCKNVE